MSDSSRERANKIDQYLEQFDELWHGENQPDIAEFLPKCPEELRDELVLPLVEIDVEYRRRNDIEVDKAIYERLAENNDQLRQRLASTMQLDSAVPQSLTGAVIGGYKVLERIGEGGFGDVYVAEQRETIYRRVALKVIKPGMDTRAVIARFEAERQAIAMMDHDNIARIYDGGTTDDQRPYFVMELVDGIPIAEYCDQKKLPTRTRLKLFVDVCRAVQHAHQKGIIHRDIKPSNVLVTTLNDQPVVKVIDFGMAKAMGFRLTDRTLYTGKNVVVGTLRYMSPEQADENEQDIDTRSDIYSLGVLLYELLAGSTPVTKKELSDGGPRRALNAISDSKFNKPSQRLRESDQASSIAEQRSTNAQNLGSLLRRDLDWVVMMALRKDRAARYQTANSLADDVERFLAGLPVEARPESLSYRLQSVWRRNKAAVLGISAAATLLIIATAVSTWFAIQAFAARERANEEAANSQSVTDFFNDELMGLQKSLGGLDLRFTPSPETLYGEVLENASSRSWRFDDQPKVALQVHGMLALAFLRIENPELAEKHVAKYSQLANELYGANSREELEAAGYQIMLAELNAREEDVEEIVQMHRDLAQRYRRELGDSSTESIVANLNLGATLRGVELYDEARSVLNEMKELAGKQFKPHDPIVLAIENNLGLIEYNDGDKKVGAQILEAAWRKGKEKLGYQEMVTQNLANNLAVAYQESGEIDKALELHEELLRAKRKHLGSRNESTVMGIYNLARTYLSLRKLPEAAELYKEALPLLDEVKGADSDFTLAARFSAAVTFLQLDNNEQALQELAILLPARTRTLGRDAPYTQLTLRLFCEAMLRLNKSEEALPLCDEALQAFESVEEQLRKWEYRHAQALTAAARAASGVGEDADRLGDEAWNGFTKTPPPRPFADVQQRTAARLAESFAANGHDELAAKWQARVTQ